jgi:hypothetical protein
MSPLHIVVAKSLADELRVCAMEPDSERRLSCYDRLAAKLVTAAPAAAPAQQAKPAAATATAASSIMAAKEAGDTSTEAGFGVANGPLSTKRAPKSLQQVTGVVAKVVQQPRGELVVTLDNGQVWLQNEGVEYFPLKVGDTVTISSAALGSFRLLAPSKRVTRVTRIQ